MTTGVAGARLDQVADQTPAGVGPQPDHRRGGRIGFVEADFDPVGQVRRRWPAGRMPTALRGEDRARRPRWPGCQAKTPATTARRRCRSSPARTGARHRRRSIASVRRAAPEHLRRSDRRCESPPRRRPAAAAAWPRAWAGGGPAGLAASAALVFGGVGGGRRLRRAALCGRSRALARRGGATGGVGGYSRQRRRPGRWSGSRNARRRGRDGNSAARHP